MADGPDDKLLKEQAPSLRERKKSEMRQHISDTATRMFLERGFNSVKVSDVADAVGVSEKTIFNYFPTKESLILDREEPIAEAIRSAVARSEPGDSLVEIMLPILAENLNDIVSHWESLEDPLRGQSIMRRFAELFSETPTLHSARLEVIARLSGVLAEVLANRAGISPDEPEPHIAATALIGLWEVQFNALSRYADGTIDGSGVGKKVTEEVMRAACLLDTGLWSFTDASQAKSQNVDSGEVDHGAKRVASALKSARRRWKASAEKNVVN